MALREEAQSSGSRVWVGRRRAQRHGKGQLTHRKLVDELPREPRVDQARLVDVAAAWACWPCGLRRRNLGGILQCSLPTCEDASDPRGSQHCCLQGWRCASDYSQIHALPDTYELDIEACRSDMDV